MKEEELSMAEKQNNIGGWEIAVDAKRVIPIYFGAVVLYNMKLIRQTAQVILRNTVRLVLMSACDRISSSGNDASASISERFAITLSTGKILRHRMPVSDAIVRRVFPLRSSTCCGAP